jgi:acetylornithine/N-succinyldiaminopimelate aminotransferase
MPLAKGLGSGVPIGAVVAHGIASDIFEPGNHGTTFGGNPLAMRAGLETIAAIEAEGLLKNAEERGQQISSGIAAALQGVAGLVEIRGRGLMIGIQLDRPCAALVGQARDAGLLINVTADSVVRLLPALTISKDEADQIVQRLAPLIRNFLTGPAA